MFSTDVVSNIKLCFDHNQKGFIIILRQVLEFNEMENYDICHFFKQMILVN